MIILVVDAAWSEKNPSGLALLKVQPGKRPDLIAVARSYEEFLELGRGQKVDWTNRVRGSKPDFIRILSKVEFLTGQKPSVIALDLPLFPYPVIGRRLCDN